MRTFNKLLPGGRGLAPVLVRRAAAVELDWDVRQKSRFDATDSQGRSLGVFLPRGRVVRGGDVLIAEDGSLLRVIAAAQPVLQVTACTAHGSSFDLLRAAYHLGNRHVPLELQPDRLQFEPDPVLAEMLRAMHLIVTEARAPFEPEAGAYSTAGTGHGHGHGHAAARTDEHHGSHQPPHDRAALAATRGRPIGIAVKSAAAPHVHGPDCGHDH